MKMMKRVLLKPFERLLCYCHRLYENMYPSTDREIDALMLEKMVMNQVESIGLMGDADELMNDDWIDSDNSFVLPEPCASPLDIMIEDLQLSVRSYNCLLRANIRTVGEIAKHSQEWLLQNVRNLGRKSVDEIVERLEILDIFLPESFEVGESAKDPMSPSALELLDKMVGLTSVKERMKDISAHCVISKLKSEVCGTEQLIVPNMLFLGNPGTGKTTVANLVARAMQEMGLMKRGHLVSVKRADLIAEYTGQSAVKTTKVFKSALDGVLFLDEAYSLYHQNGSERAGDTFSQEVIDTLTALITEYAGRCCVIFAGYHEEMDYMLEHANPGLRERFPIKIEFEDYTDEEMVEIFLLKAANQKLILSDECHSFLAEIFKRICDKKPKGFANGRISENLLQEVVLQQERRLFNHLQSGVELSKLELLTLTIEDFHKASDKISDAASPVAAKRMMGFTSQIAA